jgi:flagellar hook assembly protein FlgD
MRYRLAALVAALMLLCPPAGAHASITVDGDFSPGEWIDALELRATNTDVPWGPNNNLINLYVSWDSDNLYVGVEGFSSQNNVFFIYVDSSVLATGTEQNSFYPGFHTQSEGWDPDFVYAVGEMENGIGADVRRILAGGGTESVSGAHNASRWGYHNSNGIGGWEVSIPWSAVGTGVNGLVKVAAGLGWASDILDTSAPLGGASRDELGEDLDGDKWSLDNPVPVVYDADGDGEPDDIRAALDSVVVRFEFHAPGATSVNLAGDFNGWCHPSGSSIDTSIDPMSDPDGDDVWTIDRRLPWGYQEYKFVQDGHSWYSDPRNPDFNREDNWNSILVVTDPLVYYLSPIAGAVVSGSRPPVSASVATSQEHALDLNTLKIYIDGAVVASGPACYDPVRRTVGCTPVDSLAEGSHEVLVSACNDLDRCYADSSLFEVDLDFVPPVISHAQIGNQPANEAIIVQAVITDDEEVVSARLLYREHGAAELHAAAFGEGLNDTYYAEIPSSFAAAGRTIDYYIEASDRVNTSRSPISDTYSFNVLADEAPPVIGEYFVSPETISPNGDGRDDAARVSFRLSEAMTVDLEIYTSTGQLVRRLLQSEPLAAGYNGAIWDGKNETGATAPDGGYACRIHGRDLAGHESGEDTRPIVVNASAPDGRLNLIVLFHANQTLNYQGDTANDVCFNGLISVLRDHPASKFMLHFSGSLLHDLQWFSFRHSPSTIDMLRAGAADGQFEIVGSTYAQNIPYSTDNWDNDVQIDVHREVIAAALGASPVSFWNAERCWKQQLVPLLAGNGYSATWIETHTIMDSGTSVPEHALRKTRLGDAELTIFNDDGEFTGLLDYAIDSGDTDPLVSYLSYLHTQDTYRDFTICYCEDAEASGLWDYENGGDPQFNWNNLDHVLDVLESLGWVKLTTFSEYLETHQPTEMLAPIVDGQGSWMIGPSQQAGYADWFDYNERSPLLEFYRDFFSTWRERIRSAAQGVIPQSAADNLLRHAHRSLAAHQFEFGCIGCGGMYCQDYHKLETVEAACLAVEYAKAPVASPQVIMKDANGDGIQDVVLVTPEAFYVFSPYGGRLLYWFDLKRGEELVGNELFMWGYYYLPWREYAGGGTYNDDYHYTIDYEWNAPYHYAAAQPYRRLYGIRKKCLNEYLSIGGGAPIEELLDGELATSIAGDTIRFTLSTADFTFVKSCYPSGDGLGVQYRISNNGASPRTFNHRVENSFNPSLLEAMDFGRESLKYVSGDDTTSTIGPGTRGVKNVVSLTTMLYTFGAEPDSLTGHRDVFALELNPNYSYTLASGASARYDFSISADVVTDSSNGGTAPAYPYRLHQNYPNPFNPATTIRYDVPAAGAVTLRIYDIGGRLVRTLVNGVQSAGLKSVRWDGTNNDGLRIASGVYFCRMTAAGFAETQKIVLVR